MEQDESGLATTIAIAAIVILSLANTALGILTYRKVQSGTTQSPTATAAVTTIVAPSSGATLSGIVAIGVRPIGQNVVGVDVLATGGALHDTNIGTATISLDGWSVKWATTTVANGTYTLASAGYNSAGQADQSFTITVHVENP
jgi:hypothetical protein